jgi:hypothetical protein
MLFRTVVLTLLCSTLSFAQVPYWQTPEALTRLRSLPPLPKPHPTISYPNDAIRNQAAKDAIKEVIRITASVNTRSDFMLKSNGLWNDTLFAMAQEVGVTDVAVSVRHPFEVLSVPNDIPSLEGWTIEHHDQFQKLYDDLSATRAKAQEFGLDIKYLFVGQENVVSRSGDTEFNDSLDTVHDTVYSICRATCPNGEIVYYSRGNIAPNQGLGGWAVRPLYTLNERGKYISNDLYYPADAMLIREQMRRAAKLAFERSEGELLVPWLCLGRGFTWKYPSVGYGNESAQFHIGISNPITWWYVGRWFNWENEPWVSSHGMPLFQRHYAEMMAGEYGETARTYAGDIPFVVLWPGPFDYRDEEGHWLVDFEAYCWGSQAILIPVPEPDPVLDGVGATPPPLP